MEMKEKESIAVVTFWVIEDLSWTLSALSREVVILMTSHPTSM